MQSINNVNKAQRHTRKQQLLVEYRKQLLLVVASEKRISNASVPIHLDCCILNLVQT